jgi:hypothetical protein
MQLNSATLCAVGCKAAVLLSLLPLTAVDDALAFYEVIQKMAPAFGFSMGNILNAISK